MRFSLEHNSGFGFTITLPDWAIPLDSDYLEQIPGGKDDDIIQLKPSRLTSNLPAFE
jgi:hypothetical protein